MKNSILLLLLAAFMFSCGGGENEGGEGAGNGTPKTETESKPEEPKEIKDSEIRKFEKDGKYGLRVGYMDDAPVIVEAKYDFVGLIEPGQLVVVGNGTREEADDTFLDEGKFGYVNLKGELIVPLKYDKAENMQNGIGKVGMMDGKYVKWGAVDRKGEERMECKYSSLWPSHHGEPVTFQIDFKWGVIDSNFTVLVEPTYDVMGQYFNDGLVWVGKGRGQVMGRLRSGKYGYVNAQGEESIPLQFESASDFSEGLAPVANKKDKWGYIDQEGNVVIDYQYDYTRGFRDGVAEVDKGDEKIKIDKEGNVL